MNKLKENDSDVLVSVIVPVYDVEKYLRQCIDSIIHQSYRNLEILIIDDGSSDGSGKICDIYAGRDSRIKVFHTENRGLSAARNLGLDHANGTFISFIDSDDWFELDAIKAVIDVAKSSEADVVCFKHVTEYQGTRKLFKIKTKHKNQNTDYSKFFIGKTIMEEYCKGLYIDFGAWNKIYNKDCFSGIRFPEGRNFEDIATIYNVMLKATKVACISNRLIHYRARRQSITRSHDLKNISDYWWACYECYNELKQVSDEYEQSQIKWCVNAIGRMWRWYSGFTDAEKKSAEDLIAVMQQFVLMHQKQILADPYISRKDKCLSLCSSTINPFIMKTLYVSNHIYRILRDQGKVFE